MCTFANMGFEIWIWKYFGWTWFFIIRMYSMYHFCIHRTTALYFVNSKPNILLKKMFLAHFLIHCYFFYFIIHCYPFYMFNLWQIFIDIGYPINNNGKLLDIYLSIPIENDLTKNGNNWALLLYKKNSKFTHK